MRPTPPEKFRLRAAGEERALWQKWKCISLLHHDLWPMELSSSASRTSNPACVMMERATSLPA